MTPAHGAGLTTLPRQLLSLRVWVFHPITRATGGLLGPCFKTGRLETTFMHQSFAPKQHLPAKSIHTESHRSDFPVRLPMTSRAPTRRRRSIPHSLEPRFPHASSSPKRRLPTLGPLPLKAIDASNPHATLAWKPALTCGRLSRSITST